MYATDREVRTFHLITRFLDGGAEQSTVNSLSALQESDIPCQLHLGVGASYEEHRLAALAESGVNIHVFESMRHENLISAPLAVLSVARTLRRVEADVLHTHSTEAGIIGRWAATLAQTPIVIHEIHGDPMTSDRSAVLNGFLWALERITAPITTQYISISDIIKKEYLRRGIGNESQYVTIYDGVPVDEFANTDPSPLTKRDEQIILFAGRLSKGKGLLDLLSAFVSINERTDSRLLIAGKGELQSQLETRISELNLDSAVDLLGYRDDIPQIMKGADVFALPSYREGTPLVISEALAAGTPVVASAISGIPEQIVHGESGYLVEPGDVEELEFYLEKLLSNPGLREEMAGNARDYIQKFSVERTKQEKVQLYRELIETHL